MDITKVAIVSPGEMGAVIGHLLHDNGLDVLTCLEGRSEATRLRAEQSGFRRVASYGQLVQQADLVLSVVPPADAIVAAGQIAGAMAQTGARPAFAECNAVSPQTVERIAKLITDVGATFIDASIIGPPPREGASTRFYASGPDTSALEALSTYGLDMRVLGTTIGQASGLKMVYSASTKGTTALWTQLLTAAKALGLAEALAFELSLGRSSVVSEQIMGQIRNLPRNAERWIGEMEEVAATFANLGLTPKMLDGAAETFRFATNTGLAVQRGESDPSAAEIAEFLVQRLKS